MNANEKNFYVAVLLASLALGLIIIYFVVSIIRQHRQNLKQFRQNILAEITALEKERARIAADLHDELGPLLASVKLRVNSLELVSPNNKKEVEKTNEQIDGLIKRIREISYNLLPNTLIRKGLVAAIKEFIEFTKRGNPINIQLHSPSCINLSEQKAIHVFRMLQEIIHNTVRHSGATQLIINLFEEKDILVLKTKDNGKGFDHHAAFKNGEGFGLRNLLSRTEIIGGEMYVESAKEQGTAYTFEIRLT